MYGGAILNATISLSANASIELLDADEIIVETLDRNEQQRFELSTSCPSTGSSIYSGVYNRIQKDFPFPLRGFRLSTFVDAPAGSGLGTFPL